MKCNPAKINSFFENNIYHQDIKDLVICLLRSFSESDDFEDVLNPGVAFLDLGFYEIEKDDDLGNEKVIDFYTLSKLSPSLRKIVIKTLKKAIKRGASNDFFDEFIQDLGVIIPYDKWYRVNRKNKLKELDNGKG
jgi:hypothetical protein